MELWNYISVHYIYMLDKYVGKILIVNRYNYIVTKKQTIMMVVMTILIDTSVIKRWDMINEANDV